VHDSLVALMTGTAQTQEAISRLPQNGPPQRGGPPQRVVRRCYDWCILAGRADTLNSACRIRKPQIRWRVELLRDYAATIETKLCRRPKCVEE